MGEAGIAKCPNCDAKWRYSNLHQYGFIKWILKDHLFRFHKVATK